MNKALVVKKSLLIGSAIVASLLLGCGGGEGDKASGAKATSANESASKASKPAQASTQNLDKKMSVYIKCFNAARQIDNSIDRYESWVTNMNTGPTGKERSVWGVYNIDIGNTEQCQKNITEVAALTPVTELDEAAIVFANSALALAKANNAVYQYYDQKDFKDDDFKKGKELHTPIAKAIQEYVPASNKFSGFIEVENDKRQAAQLAQIEKSQGKNASYYKLSIMIQAKAIANLLYEEKFSVDKAKELLDQYTQTLEAASNYSKDPNNKQAIKKLGVMAESGFSRLIRAGEDFNKSAKERYRGIRDNKPVRATNAATVRFTTGTVQNIQAKYNDLVQTFNRGF